MCGSARTEELYLRGLRDSAMNRAVDVKVINKPKAPLQVVKHAIVEADRSRPGFDELWCVFDVDEFAIDEAVQLASEHGVELAISNPCFELWLLLHFDECTTYLTSYKAAAARLKRHVQHYDKARLHFPEYAPGVVKAIARARKLGDTGNPSTGMWRLATKVLPEEDER